MKEGERGETDPPTKSQENMVGRNVRRIEIMFGEQEEEKAHVPYWCAKREWWHEPLINYAGMGGRRRRRGKRKSW